MSFEMSERPSDSQCFLQAQVIKSELLNMRSCRFLQLYQALFIYAIYVVLW